jgi:hypothetical protein
VQQQHRRPRPAVIAAAVLHGVESTSGGAASGPLQPSLHSHEPTRSAGPVRSERWRNRRTVMRRECETRSRAGTRISDAATCSLECAARRANLDSWSGGQPL